MITNINKLNNLIKQFGVVYTAKYCFYKFRHQDEKYIKLVYEKLYDILSPLIEQYNCMDTTMFREDEMAYDCVNDGKISSDVRSENKKLIEKTPIWVCWWQGYEKMPRLCKLCYEQLRRMLPDNVELHLITLENYEKYTHIPEYVKTKFEKGYISMTAYSDVLRNCLIRENGGFWIDSTIYVSSKIDAKFMEDKNWWSIKAPIDEDTVENLGQKISARKWSSFIQKGVAGNPINCFVMDAFLLYFKKYNYLIDYFFQNMCIKIAYDHIPKIHDMIERIPISNVDVYSYYDHIDEMFDQKQYNEWNEHTQFYKLTYKRNYDCLNKEGKLTYYGFFEDVCKSKESLK